MQGKPIHILILEDSPDDFKLVALELKKAEFDSEISHATGKESFEELVSKQLPDVILSDYNIPGYDIIQALNYLKHHEYDGPFILITGALIDEEALDLIVNHDVNDYILKENLSKLNAAIYREYEKVQLQRDLLEKNRELEKLSMVASHTHNGVIITDPKGVIEWVNDGYIKITGYSRDESLGRKPCDLLQGEKTDPATVERISKKLKQAVPFTEEILNYHKNGTPYWIKLDITPITDGNDNVIQTIAIQEDITERKEAQQRVLKSNQRLVQAQQVGQIGDWDFDVETGAITWSPELYKIYERDRALGPPDYEDLMTYYSKEAQIILNNHVQRSIEQGIEFNFETPITTGDNNHKYIRTVGIATKNEEGEVKKLRGIVQDITDQKEAELALKEKTNQLNDIIDNLNSVVFTYVMHPDRTQEFAYLSDGVQDLYGISKEKALEDVKNIFDHVHPDDLAEVEATILTSAETLTIWDQTYRYIMPGGEIKHLRGRGAPHKDGDKIIWNTIIIDETEHALDELRKQELEQLFQSSLNEIFVFDAESLKFVYCNQAAIENTQYSQDELKEMTPLHLKGDLSKKNYLKLVEKTQNGGHTSFESTHTRKDGSRYNVLVDARLNTYKGEPVYVTNVLDTTELTQAREQLSREQRLKELAVEGSEIGLWEVDLNTYETFYNDMYFKMLGYDSEEIIRSFGFYKSIIHPEDEPVIDEIYNQIFAGKVDRFEEKVRLKSKSGQYLWVLSKGKVIEYDSEGNSSILAGSNIDITKLEKAIQEKDILMQEVHHRVKNNLAIISGMIDLQLMRDDEDTGDQLEDAKNRIHAIAAVHNQLYNTDTFSEIKMDSYFESLIAKTKDSFLGKDQDISVNFESDVDIININQAVPLGLLINELITNSLKHAFPNRKGAISIKLSDCGYNKVGFSYEDSGKGYKQDTKKGLGLELIHTLIHQLTYDYQLVTKSEYSLQFMFEITDRGAYSNLRSNGSS